MKTFFILLLVLTVGALLGVIISDIVFFIFNIGGLVVLAAILQSAFQLGLLFLILYMLTKEIKSLLNK